MPNHFHFLIYTRFDFDPQKLTKSLKILLSSYTKAINIQNKTSGSLFQQHTKAKYLSYESKYDTDYGLICFNYIHQNPFIAGLVKKIEDWEFSSFRDFIGLCNGTLCNMDFTCNLLNLPKDVKDLYNLSYNNINSIHIESIF